jgi:cysteine synthase A
LTRHGAGRGIHVPGTGLPTDPAWTELRSGERNMGQTEDILERSVRRCRERHIIIPTFEQMCYPDRIPAGIRDRLSSVGLWDNHPLNLFRICWKNEPVLSGGAFGDVNVLEVPKALTGIEARILVLLAKYFPTGSHKVGPAFGSLVEKLVQGRFDPTRQKALWPSTGNFCRGGAYVASLMSCPSIAVLPEEMSQERFQWLRGLGTEIQSTPGSESNVKEVFDRTEELKRERSDEVVVLNQFSEFGNSLWHYACTGRAIEEVAAKLLSPEERFAALFLTQGSAGTLASGDYLSERFPRIKLCAGEALQCPTMLYNGYGTHRIEGIGDKHVPWIFNVRSIDVAAALDDDHCLRAMRLFNEPAGQSVLRKLKVPEEAIRRLPDLGISGIANLLGCIKIARYFEMGEGDVLITLATDSMDLYLSRLEELRRLSGPYSETQAHMDFERAVAGQSIDFVKELGYWDRKRIHNLKYFTWVEQRGMEDGELTRQWMDETYWKDKYQALEILDEQINEFNRRTGLLSGTDISRL